MIGRPTRVRLLFYLLALTLLSGAGQLAAQQVARDETAVRITAVDTSTFPTVRVRLLATGAGGAPLADLSRLTLRENGVPIPDATLAATPVGIDLAVVIDANADFLLADEPGGATRREQVAASLERFAAGNMNTAGLDRVSIIVPDEARLSPVVLIDDATAPDEVAAAVLAYVPTGPTDQPRRATPLQAMLAAAIDHLAARTADGRFQAVLLYSDGARLDRQLDYPPLVEAAQVAGIPVYVAILGAAASPDELANAGRLTQPTNGQTLHMPAPEAADPLYALFAAHGDQPELVYRSAARQNGPQQVAVNLGNVRATATYELALAAPEVALELPATTIRRAGSAVDTPLPLLQPAVLPLAARVAWPDGQQRPLTEVRFLVDGVAQPLAGQPQPDEDGRLPLTWDISERDAGVYRLSVEVADELGFRATAAPVTLTIEVARPSPPTPTIAPTAEPAAAPAARSAAALVVPVLLLAGAGGALLWATRRARRPSAPPPAPEPEPPPARASGDGHVPILEWRSAAGQVEQIELLADNVTLGRQPGEVDIVLDDSSVSRLHARIRRNAEEEYWLYDEGSATGTFLNYERLGLAARQMRHGDSVQLGRVALRFRLELARPPAATVIESPEEAAAEAIAGDPGDDAPVATPAGNGLEQATAIPDEPPVEAEAGAPAADLPGATGVESATDEPALVWDEPLTAPAPEETPLTMPPDSEEKES